MGLIPKVLHPTQNALNTLVGHCYAPYVFKIEEFFTNCTLLSSLQNFLIF